MSTPFSLVNFRIAMASSRLIALLPLASAISLARSTHARHRVRAVVDLDRLDQVAPQDDARPVLQLRRAPSRARWPRAFSTQRAMSPLS